jgi:integrase
MARRAKGLTAAFVEKVTQPRRYGDGGNLYLEVKSRRVKSYTLIYTSPLTGKRREVGLGPAIDPNRVPLADARAKARQLLALVREGKDPLHERETNAAQAKADALKAQATAVTFAQVTDLYIMAHERSWRSAKHAQEWRTTVERYAVPVIGDLPIGDIDTGVVMKILEPLWRNKTETASRVRGRIEAVIDYARARDWCKGENPARWRGHLDQILPPRSKAQRVEHHKALPWREVGAFMQRLRQNTSLGAQCLQFLILTATRSGEARLARWDEIDLANALWTIPAERMKGGREHRVPLSPPALAVLREMKELGDEGFIFPGARYAAALSDVTLTRTVRYAGGGDTTVHGYRSTFRDWCGETTNYPREVAEAALAHTLGNRVEAAYRRGDLLEKRRRLMNEWAEFCSRPMVAGEVVPLRAPA